MSNRSGILAGGNWIVDKIKFIDTYPQQDALANILTESQGNGGSPFNVLLDLANLGMTFPLAGVGLVGDDGEGEWIRSHCEQHDVETTQLQICEDTPTSYTDVMTVRSTGRRTFFHQRGANARLDVDHFDLSSSNAKIFHLGYLLLLDRLDEPDAEFGTRAARLLQAATQAGFKTSIDVVSEDSQRFSEVVLPALRFTDYCILNEFELERTTGIATRKSDVIDRDAIHAGAKLLLESGVREWVIVHFPEGACALSREGAFHLQASLRVPPERIVSSLGAGDAFAAGALQALHGDAGIEAVLRDGVCVAASCLFGTGTSNGILPLEKCRALEQEFGFRSH